MEPGYVHPSITPARLSRYPGRYPGPLPPPSAGSHFGHARRESRGLSGRGAASACPGAECHNHHELEGGVRVAAVKSLTWEQRQQPDGQPSPPPRSEGSARSARAETDWRILP